MILAKFKDACGREGLIAVALRGFECELFSSRPSVVWWHSDGNPSFCELFLATGTDLREKPRLVQPTLALDFFVSPADGRLLELQVMTQSCQLQCPCLSMSRVHIETHSYLPNYVPDTASVLMYSPGVRAYDYHIHITELTLVRVCAYGLWTQTLGSRSHNELSCSPDKCSRECSALRPREFQ